MDKTVGWGLRWMTPYSWHQWYDSRSQSTASQVGSSKASCFTWKDDWVHSLLTLHRVVAWVTWTVKSVVYMKSLMYSQAAGKQKQPVHLWLTVSSQPVSLWWKIWKGSEGSRDMFVGTKPHLWVDTVPWMVSPYTLPSIPYIWPFVYL